MTTNTARERLADILERSGYTRECAAQPGLVRHLPDGDFAVLCSGWEPDGEHWVALFLVDEDGSGDWAAKPLFESTDRDLEADFLMDLGREPPRAGEVLGELVEWAGRMGGFESQVWQDAEEVLSGRAVVL